MNTLKGPTPIVESKVEALRALAWCLVLCLTGCAAAIPMLQSGAAVIAAHVSAAPVAAIAGAAGVGVGVGVIVSDDVRKMVREARESRDEVFPAGTFGAFFQESQAAVMTLVQLAMRGQRDTQIVAGLQVYSALAKGRAVFRDSRALKIDSLPGPEGKFRAEMDSAMTELISASEVAIKASGERAADAAARLRLVTDAPQVRSAGPMFLFPFLPNQEITIRGDFPATYEKESPPMLIVDGKSYKAFEYQADSIRFSIRTADLDAFEPNETVWKAGELSVPWSRAGTGFGNVVEIEKFRVVIGVLTQSFGNLVLEKSIAKIRSEEKGRNSVNFPFSSDALKSDESRCLNLTVAEISEGWKIRPGSGSISLDARDISGQSHEWKDLGVEVERDHSLCWRVRAFQTAPDFSGESGRTSRASWRISAMINLDHRELHVDTERVDLAWGSKHSFNVPAGSWKLRYTRNGSPVRELTATDTSNPLIRVQTEGARIQVRVYPF